MKTTTARAEREVAAVGDAEARLRRMPKASSLKTRLKQREFALVAELYIRGVK